jgi:ABC-type antimicrobial peptide transport system permease subunit
MVLVPPEVERFQIDFGAFERAVGEHTKGVLINSPNNPSGVVYSRATLERLAGLVGTMVTVIIIVSAVMLSLILFLWMRERVHETGIYLSIGIQKTKIACQQVLENLAVATAAFFLAWGICAAALGLAGNMIADSLMESGGYEISSGAAEEEEGGLSLRAGAEELAKIAGVETALVLLSTGISSAAVLRMRPKDILSKMS